MEATLVREEKEIKFGENAGKLGVMVSWPHQYSEIESIRLVIEAELNFQLVPFHFNSMVDENTLKKIRFFLKRKLAVLTKNLDVDEVPLALCNVNVNPRGLTPKNLALARKTYRETAIAILGEKLAEASLKGNRVLWKNLLSEKTIILFPWEQE